MGVMSCTSHLSPPIFSSNLSPTHIPPPNSKAMSSVIQTFQNRSPALPLSQPDPTIRRRLSSLSLKFHPTSSDWALRRTKSVSSAGDSIRKWWEWGWGWILSRKPTFVVDLEMNEEETAILGSHSKGSLRHVFYKVRVQFRKLLGSDNVGLPQTFRYNSYNYAKNFDGNKTSSFRW